MGVVWCGVVVNTAVALFSGYGLSTSLLAANTEMFIRSESTIMSHDRSPMPFTRIAKLARIPRNTLSLVDPSTHTTTAGTLEPPLRAPDVSNS